MVLHECIDVRAFFVFLSKFALADCARHVYKKDTYYAKRHVLCKEARMEDCTDLKNRALSL